MSGAPTGVEGAHATADAEGAIRIDELAQRSGIASGTIRFYQREGLIAAPRREGRVAYYSEGHLDRLERIRALQAHGLPLRIIGDLLDREDAGEDIGGWLALDTAVFGVGAEPEAVDPTALAELGFGEADVAVLEAAGVLASADGGRLAAVPGMMELFTRLVEADVPVSAIREGAGFVAIRLAEVADAMASLGWQAFSTERERIVGDDSAVAEETLAKLEHLRSLARRIVSTHFPILLDDAIRSHVAEFAEKAVIRRREGGERESLAG